MGIATKPLELLPDNEQSFSEMLDRHKRHIGMVAMAIVIVGVGEWFYARSKAIKEDRAEAQFESAMQSIFSGNTKLAESDLSKVVVRYEGTVAGSEAVLQLAQLYYNEGKFKAGVDLLKKANPVKDLAYDVQSMIGIGYEGLNQGAEAATAYENAAQKARFTTDRDLARSNAARAYLSAGNIDAAVKIWSELANDVKNPLAPEARVRLGEVQAKVIKA